MNARTYFKYPRYLQRFRKVDADELLNRIGLQTRRTMVRTMLATSGVFATGVLLGATLGMAFAPRRGEQMRREMREKAESVKARVGRYKERAMPGGNGSREAPPPAGA